MTTVLIVDDEAHIRTLVRSLLPKRAGLQVVGEAANGREALEKCRRCKPQVVLTDIRMPELDGLGLAERLAAELPETKVIVISGYDDFEYARRALQYGVIGYLLKPIEELELLDVLERAVALLKRREEESSRYASVRRELCKMQENLPAAAPSVSYSDSPVIQKVMEMIHAGYNQEISLDAIADKLYMNSAYLSRLFKEKTGRGFQEVLTEVRLARACQLLRMPALRVKEVADMVGYRDASHFIRIFREHTGVTPSEYRAAQMGRPDPTEVEST